MTAAGACLLVALALLGDSGRRRVGAAGLGALALGVAARAAAPGGAPADYLVVNTGLLLLGVVLAAGAVGAGFPRGDARSRAAAIVAAGGVVLAGLDLGPDLRTIGVRALLAGLGIGVVAVGLARGGARLGLGDVLRRHAWSDRPPLRMPWLAALLVATALGAGAQWIPLLLAAAAAGAWAGWLTLPPVHRSRPLAATLATLFLGVTLWLFATISGPEGLGLDALGWLPLSPAAERGLGLLFVGALWSLSGLWPLSQPRHGLLTTPLGVILLLRLAWPGLPAGMLHWQSLAFPLIVVGLWHAAVTRRPAGLLVGGAWLGLLSLDSEGLAGAVWLLATAGAWEAAGLRWKGQGTPWPARVALALAGGWGALMVATAGLRVEVVYTVLAAGAAAVGLAGRPLPPPGGGGALTPPPSGSIFGRETL